MSVRQGPSVHQCNSSIAVFDALKTTFCPVLCPEIPENVSYIVSPLAVYTKVLSHRKAEALMVTAYLFDIRKISTTKAAISYFALFMNQQLSYLSKQTNKQTK